ncbi:MAG: DUF1351 domain-containing protein [Ruminococcus flavefaciens]|nr:DUF1351 domain-containing protein [Ruminococcus flavefaciens]
MANNELTLRLATPIEKLVPAMIAFNNAELMEGVKARLVAYQGKTYDADSIGEAKADRATLNKFSKALNDERLRIKKIYTLPLDKFTSEINEVIAVVDQVTATIDTQVKVWETDCKERKLAEIKAYFAEVFPAELSVFISFEKIQQSDWLNASKSMTAIKKEIDATIEKIKTELATIEALGGDVVAIKQKYFEDLSLANAITEHKRIAAEKQRIAQQAAETKKDEPAPVQEPVAAVDEKVFTLAFKVTGTAAQLNALKAFMTENKIKFERA